MSRAHHTDIAYPHEGGCSECRALEICNCCGNPAPKATRCTNGHCARCHGSVCTPGGITGPGHGHGTKDVREAACHRIQQEGIGRTNFDAWVHRDDVEPMQQCADVLNYSRSLTQRIMSNDRQKLTPEEVLYLQDLSVVRRALKRLAGRRT